MKKIKKTVKKENSKRLRKKDNLFIVEISLDDKENQEYFDRLSYEEYLKTLNSEEGNFYDE